MALLILTACKGSDQRTPTNPELDDLDTTVTPPLPPEPPQPPEPPVPPTPPQPPAPPPETHDAIYVAPDGDTKNGTGSLEKPYASVHHALEMQRTLRADGEARDVVLRGGTYYLSRSVQLSSDDSGTDQEPTVIRAFEDEIPVLSGAIAIDTSCARPLPPDDLRWHFLDETVQGRVYECTNALPQQQPEALGNNPETPSYPQLLVDTNAYTLARHPNTGFANITHATKLQFGYEDPKLHALAAAPHTRIEGFLEFFWRYQMQNVVSINPMMQLITIGDNISKTTKPGERFRAVNAPAFLDAADEYYLDWARQSILFLTPENEAPKHIELSWLGGQQDALIHIDNAQHIVIDGLRLQDGRWHGVQVRDSHDVLLRALDVQRMGHWGMHIKGGERVGVINSQLHHLGRGGIYLYGGDRATLTHAQHFALNNHIHHYGQLVPTYRHGIYLYGAGNIAAYNHIHDAPHSAIQFEGNEHRVELNHIHDVIQFSDDTGAIYAYYDASAFGTQVRWNQIHSIDSEAPHGVGNHGIYLDGGYGPIHMFGNILHDITGNGIFLNKGHFNAVSNNIIANVHTAILSTGGPMTEGQRAEHYRAAYDYATHDAWEKYRTRIHKYPKEGGNPAYFSFFKKIVGTQVHSNLFSNVDREFRTASPNDSVFSQPRIVRKANYTLLADAWHDLQDFSQGLRDSPIVNSMGRWQNLPWKTLQQRRHTVGVHEQWEVTQDSSSPSAILQAYNTMISSFQYAPPLPVDTQALFEEHQAQ